MRSYFTVIFCVFVLAGPIGAKERPKRFLRRDFFNPLSDRLLGLGDMARDFSDQLTSQAQVAVAQMVPHAVQAVSGLTTFGRQVGQQVRDGLQKRSRTGAALEREDEEDGTARKDVSGEVFRPTRPPIIALSPLLPANPFFGLGLFTPWWQGPNVCEEKNEIEEPEKESSGMSGFSFNLETTRCVPSSSMYICTKKIQNSETSRTIVIKRKCCHGFVRRTDGRPGCSELKMENLLDTVKTLEMNKFSQWIENGGLEEKLKSENLTIFTPSNEAIIDFEDDTDDNEISQINPAKSKSTSEVLSRHIVEGFQNVDAFADEHLMDTFDTNTKIRINKYRPGKEVVTANCVPLSGRNHFATNGIVHLTSDVIPRPKMTIGESIETEERFSMFRKLMLNSGLLDDLKKLDQPWTVFVPTDEAFGDLPQSLRKQLESGEGCTQTILHQHVVKGTVCGAAVVSKGHLRNILDNLIELTKDEADKITVQGAGVVSENNVRTNGVIHVIDKVLIPRQARDFLKALKDEDRTDLLDLINRANMSSEFEESRNLTFFLPTKEAFKNLPNETRERMANDPEFVKQLLRHHLMSSHIPTHQFSQNKKLTTLNGQDVHLKLHSLFPGIVTSVTVQCANMVGQDNEVCGGVMHKINKVMMPPKGTIIETLKAMDGHDIVVKLLKNTDLEKKLSETGSFTFLAPTDEAFERMGDIQLEHLLENRTMAEDVLKMHVLPEILCCNGVHHASPFQRQYARTLDGSALPLFRGLAVDRVRFGRARTEKCDIPATNGLVHSVNKVVLPEERPTLRVNLWPMFA